jgi:preprotein translocase subunit SecY
MAGQFGSIMTMGIGPIVTASIILQLLVGGKILNLDLSQHEDKAFFQGTQKLLAIIFTIGEAMVYVFTGALSQHHLNLYGLWSCNWLLEGS